MTRRTATIQLILILLAVVWAVMLITSMVIAEEGGPSLPNLIITITMWIMISVSGLLIVLILVLKVINLITIIRR